MLWFEAGCSHTRGSSDGEYWRDIITSMLGDSSRKIRKASGVHELELSAICSSCVNHHSGQRSSAQSIVAYSILAVSIAAAARSGLIPEGTNCVHLRSMPLLQAHMGRFLSLLRLSPSIL